MMVLVTLILNTILYIDIPYDDVRGVAVSFKDGDNQSWIPMNRTAGLRRLFFTTDLPPHLEDDDNNNTIIEKYQLKFEMNDSTSAVMPWRSVPTTAAMTSPPPPLEHEIYKIFVLSCVVITLMFFALAKFLFKTVKRSLESSCNIKINEIGRAHV